MRYVFTLLLAVLFALPTFAQMEMGVDNCCQMGRACETDAEWVQGYYDYRSGMCGSDMMSDDMGMMSDDMGMMSDDMAMMGMSQDVGFTHTFTGKGRVKKSARFTLTPGKWNLNAVISDRWADIAWVNIVQIDPAGEFNKDGDCLANSRVWTWYGVGYWWLFFPDPGSYVFTVTQRCEAVFQIAHSLNVDTVRDMDWKLFIKKIDSNAY